MPVPSPSMLPRSSKSRKRPITTEAADADGGNITIAATEWVYLLYGDITATVGGGLGNGGNIFIDPEFVILNNSRITANAYQGRGGNIRIIADQFLADNVSVVEASSQLGIDGIVQIEAPDADVSSGLTMLPASFLDVTGLLQDRCEARSSADASSLFVVGRGGMPITPDDYLLDITGGYSVQRNKEKDEPSAETPEESDTRQPD